MVNGKLVVYIMVSNFMYVCIWWGDERWEYKKEGRMKYGIDLLI